MRSRMPLSLTIFTPLSRAGCWDVASTERDTMRRRLRYVRRYQGTSSELNHGQSRTGDVFLLLRGAFDCAVATVAATAVTAGSPAAGVAGEARLRAPAGARPLRRELDQAARLLMIAPVFLAPAALCTVAETFGTRLIALPVTCAVQQLDARGAQALASIDRVIRQLELGPGPLPSRSAPSVELMELFGALVRPPSPSPYHALSNTMGREAKRARNVCASRTVCACVDLRSGFTGSIMSRPSSPARCAGFACGCTRHTAAATSRSYTASSGHAARTASHP